MQGRIAIVAGLIFSLVGCEPKPESYELYDQLVVSTSYDNTVDFSSYSTYSISTDTIGFYSNASNDTVIVQRESEFPRPVLQQIQSNLDARGYTRVEKNASPDLAISVAVINDFNVFQEVVYPGGYGGYGYGYYYPYYYGYGGYYAGYVNTYTSNTGVLIIEILDLKNRTADNKVKAIWTANMGDIYSTVDLIEQATEAIDQSFSQSPYIDAP